MNRALCLLVGIALTFPAFALDQPKQSKYDPRIQRVSYNAEDVVEINAAVGYATHIVLEEGEEIPRNGIASGFSSGWEFSDAKNNFFLKPISVKDSENKTIQPRADVWNTNLTLITNRRHYSFMLKLHEQPNPKVSFRVVFDYPESVAAAARIKADKQATAQRMAARPAPRNWHYTMHIGPNSQEIAPNMCYDDGRFTYIRFPGNREIPTFFAVADNRAESMVNVHIDPKRPDTVVIQRVLKQFNLRSGEMVVGVYNEQFDPVGLPPENGTTIPGVKRRIKDEAASPVADQSFIPTPPPAPVTPAPASLSYGQAYADPRAPVVPAQPPLKRGDDDE